MRVLDFDFALPDALVAQEPTTVRGESRLLVLNRESGAIVHTTFDRIGEFLRAGDLVVLNNTRVFPARLSGVRVPSGGAVECLLLGRVGTNIWDALVHPGQKLRPGSLMRFGEAPFRLEAEILERHFFGRRTVRLSAPDGRDVDTLVDAIGHVPLPPYIKRSDSPSDRERYQTVYASRRGSIAAPTAGLHFTEHLLSDLARRGIERTEITLHVGYGTFKPVRTAEVADHTVDAEAFEVSMAAANSIGRALADGQRVVAIGSTTVRTLESLLLIDGRPQPASGETALFIRPPHDFRVVSGLVTNFHLPRSSLLMLVSAFAGREHVLSAYREAVERRYRFYSYGDAMLVL